MANLLQRSVRGRRDISTIDDYIQALNGFIYNGNVYGLGDAVQQTLAGERVERIPTDFASYARSGYAANDVVFACMLIRMLVFSSVRVQYQRLNQGRPSRLFGARELAILEQPWFGATTQDLLMAMLVDADLSGNSYWLRLGDELIRLRPDWTAIALAPRQIGRRVVGYERVGYVYQEDGFGSEFEPAVFGVNEIAHFAPLPDPLASFRGMSWLTPVIRQIQNDGLMNRHKQRFFENAATPNMVVSLDPSVKPEMFERFKEKMDLEHKGADNAYKTLYLGGGADVTVVGSNFEQMSFKAIQGHGETRIAAAAGVPPVIAGFSEGLQAATYSNYTQARRRFADGTMHPLWQSAAGALQPLVRQPPASRLWYDARDVPFLREDEKDAAQIQSTRAQTIRTLIDSGYEPESVIDAVEAEDFTLLNHSGLYSVQLQEPGADDQPSAEGSE